MKILTVGVRTVFFLVEEIPKPNKSHLQSVTFHSGLTHLLLVGVQSEHSTTQSTLNFYCTVRLYAHCFIWDSPALTRAVRRHQFLHVDVQSEYRLLSY